MRMFLPFSAVMLACAALMPPPAKAGPIYDLSLMSERGTVTDDGTSLGAYTEFPNFLSWQGMETNGTYPSDIFVSPTLLDPTAVSKTTLNYASGTGGLADQPIIVAVSLPDPDNVTTPYFYTMTGLVSLTGTFTNTGTGSTFNFAMEFIDPEDDTLVDKFAVSGDVVAGGVGAAFDSYADTFAFETGVNEAIGRNLVITAKSSGDGALVLVPEPASASVLGVGLVAFLLSRRRVRASSITQFPSG